jgi:hypothetical protein
MNQLSSSTNEGVVVFGWNYYVFAHNVSLPQ